MEEPTPGPSSVDNAPPLRILVVDDNRDTTQMMALILKYEGYSVSTAFDGPDAIETARNHRPHVVLLDLTLPSMSGTDVANHLRAEASLSPCYIAAVSGYERDHPSHGGPFDAHLKKPVDYKILCRKLAEWSALVTHSQQQNAQVASNG